MITAAARLRAATLRDGFAARGAQVVEPPILQDASLLLDLYGEDIRARAYVTSDALRGEQMLRPDFTVPVVQMHMESGASPARYTYAGEVFRRQDDTPDRDSEYLQVGFELIGGTDAAADDAEVFTLMARATAPLGAVPATGDIGILMAAVDGLRTTEPRRAALRRHIWRPRRFRALLDQFAGRIPMPEARAALLANAEPLKGAGPIIGLRTEAEINDRITALHADTAAGGLSAVEVDLLQGVLDVRETLPFALARLRDLALDLPSIAAAVDRLSARTDALASRGVDVDSLAFEASYGRTSMEYYDGFVFGFAIPSRPDLPPLASGGRYDALTARLGKGRAIPAVGAVLRPGLMVALEGEP
ncbi:MAG: ATP phosphoribosyltransferase regulatory subunit [Pseudomonadota bacterium]